MKEKFLKIYKLLIISFVIIFSKINVLAQESCESILSNGLMGSIRDNILSPLRFIAPILLLIFTTLDFAKVVFSDSKDGMSKAWKNFIRRAVATLLVFFAKNIVSFIYSFVTYGTPCL